MNEVSQEIEARLIDLISDCGDLAVIDTASGFVLAPSAMFTLAHRIATDDVLRQLMCR